CSDVSPPWKGEGSLPEGSSFPSSIRDYISHLRGRGVPELPPHEKRGLSSKLRLVPLRGKRDGRCSSHSPIKPPIELGRSVISVTKRKIELIFKYKGAIHPRWRGFPPLNPQFL
ncbi:hypothetical protein B9Q00_04725, partial [Candidatus Marsarchaeota G1 archaeon OSP_C]